jgi:hypothetical protein
VAIRWIASGCAAREASRQIEVATGRIHDLVGAVKGFTQPGRTVFRVLLPAAEAPPSAGRP